MIGLGRMGGNMAQRLLLAGHRVVAYDRSAEAVQASASQGAVTAGSPEDMVSQLSAPRAVWLMLPAGDPTEETIDELIPLLSPGDVVLDGGNAYYKDTLRRGGKLAGYGLDFMDVGTSGGVWGLSQGYSLMIGGPAETFRRLEPIFQSLAPAPDRGYSNVGPVGAGHFVKMVHNGVEYGLMQAYAEGLELLQAKPEFDLDLRQIAETWRHGSVVRSWLLDLAVAALEEDPDLESLQALRGRLRRRPGGPCRNRWTWRCRYRSSRCRCSSGSARGRKNPSAAGCWRPSGVNSAATRCGKGNKEVLRESQDERLKGPDRERVEGLTSGPVQPAVTPITHGGRYAHGVDCGVRRVAAGPGASGA